MKFLADASVDLRLVRRLRQIGLDVGAVIEHAPSLADPDVLRWSVRENAVLITEDKDFGDILFKTGGEAKGVILLRVRIADDTDVAVVADRIVALASRCDGAFVVMTAKQTRVRALPERQ